MPLLNVRTVEADGLYGLYETTLAIDLWAFSVLLFPCYYLCNMCLRCCGWYDFISHAEMFVIHLTILRDAVHFFHKVLHQLSLWAFNFFFIFSYDIWHVASLSLVQWVARGGGSNVGNAMTLNLTTHMRYNKVKCGD